MIGAKKVGADQWITNTVFHDCQKGQVFQTSNHEYEMEGGTDGKKATARLVVKGFTDPDLTQNSYRVINSFKSWQELFASASCKLSHENQHG